MAKKFGLGAGLDALMGEANEEKENEVAEVKAEKKAPAKKSKLAKRPIISGLRHRIVLTIGRFFHSQK